MINPFDPNPYPEGHEPSDPPDWYDPDEDDWDDD